MKLVDSQKPCVLEAEQLKLVSLLWKLKLTGINSIKEFDAFRLKPILPTTGGKMYPICLAKQVLGKPDDFLCQIMLDLGYSKIDMDQVQCELSLIVEKMTFSKAEDFLSCFKLGMPPNPGHDLSSEQVNWLVISLSSYSKEDLLGISSVLLNLKLYRHADDKHYVSIGTSRCIIVPDRIPKSGLHLLKSETVFLKEPAATTKGFYKSVIKNYSSTLIKSEEMYLCYIIPSLPSMNEEQIIVYIDNLRSNPDLESSQPIIDLLTETKLFVCAEVLVCAKDLYDPRIDMFKAFRRHQLPSKVWHTNARLDFLCKIGLCCQVSTKEWICQAEKVAAFELDTIRIDSSILLINQLLKIVRESPKDHTLDEFLTAVSDIPFMYNPLDYKYFTFAKRLKLKLDFSPMVKFRSSISSQNTSIGFCLCSVMPGKCDELISNPKIRKPLQMEHPVKTETVVENLKCICTALNSISCFDGDSSSLKDAIGIICQHYAFLDKVDLGPDVVSTLTEMACIIIHTDDALSTMVRPSQVVEQLPSDINLQPFYYRLRASIAQYTSFTESLGIKKELSATDYQNLLNDIHKEGSSQDDQTQKVAKCAYHELIRCLRQDQISQTIMKNGFLLNEKLQLVTSCDLLYNDVPWYSTRIPSDMFQFILMPKSDAQGSKKPPRTLNVRSLSEAITEKVHEVCRSPDVQCKHDLLYSQHKRKYRCTVTDKVMATLSSPQFVEGMYRIYYDDHHSNPPQSFQKVLNTFKKFEIICLDVELTTVLCHNHTVIPSSQNSSQTCMLSREEGIIFISPHGPEFDIKTLLKELSKQLNLALDHAIKNEQNIATLFECEPEHISALLTQNQIPEYSFHDEDHTSTNDVGTTLSLATLSPHEALIVINFRQDEKVKYYSPSGELIFARVVTSHVSMEGKKITSRCIEISTSDLKDDDESFLVSPLEVFKILTLPQIKSLQSGKPNQFASPLNMAAVPCENVEKITAWIKQLYCSEDVLMYSGLLLSMVKIRLMAHLHFHLHTGNVSAELFRHAVLQVLDCVVDEPLPYCLSHDNTEEIISLCNFMEKLSLECEESNSNSEDEDSEKEYEGSERKGGSEKEYEGSEKEGASTFTGTKRVDTYCYTTKKSNERCDYSRYHINVKRSSPASKPKPCPAPIPSQVPVTRQSMGTVYSRFSPKKSVKTIPSRFKSVASQAEKKKPPTPPIHKEKARAWLEQAKADFKAVQVLCEVNSEVHGGAGKCQFPALVCFLCHDVVEKCLKGLLFVYVEKINQQIMNCSNLVTVLQLLKSNDSMCSDQNLITVLHDTVMVVSVYETKSRYPSLHNSFTAPAAVYVPSDSAEAFGAVSTLITSLTAVQVISEIIGDLGITPKPKFISSMKSTSAECKFCFLSVT